MILYYRIARLSFYISLSKVIKKRIISTYNKKAACEEINHNPWGGIDDLICFHRRPVGINRINSMENKALFRSNWNSECVLLKNTTNKHQAH